MTTPTSVSPVPAGDGPAGRPLGDEPLMTVAGLRHEYVTGKERHLAIAQVSFEVRRGELVSIVGPSGAGKTTLLRCLSGLLAPTEGDLRLAGRAITGVPRELAMVFQDYSRSLFPWFTVRKNVALPLRHLRLEKAERARRVEDSLRAVGLGEAMDKYPWQLSGGMQQRVAIARALAYRPQILLMDEPFASVDAQTRSDLEDLVLRIRREFDMTILFVTHDIDESVYLSDRVLVLSRPPSTLAATIEVGLGPERDQIATRQDPRFVTHRAEIATLIKG